jgi:hypothetical protein
MFIAKVMAGSLKALETQFCTYVILNIDQTVRGNEL